MTEIPVAGPGPRFTARGRFGIGHTMPDGSLFGEPVVLNSARFEFAPIGARGSGNQQF